MMMIIIIIVAVVITLIIIIYSYKLGCVCQLQNDFKARNTAVWKLAELL